MCVHDSGQETVDCCIYYFVGLFSPISVHLLIMAATKIRWGDTLDDDDSLPPNSIVGPDKQGIKTITDYKKNDKGEIVKTVTKIRVSRVEKKIYAVREEHS